MLKLSCRETEHIGRHRYIPNLNLIMTNLKLKFVGMIGRDDPQGGIEGTAAVGMLAWLCSHSLMSPLYRMAGQEGISDCLVVALVTWLYRMTERTDYRTTYLRLSDLLSTIGALLKNV